MVVLPTAYLAPRAWYEALLGAQARGEECRIEVMESFPKQTYRNRCTILTPDGPLTLSVPVRKVESKQLTRDVEISYQTRWQHQHWMAIMSAYKHTPYFDYFQDYLRPWYEKETRFLVDLNDGLQETVMQLLHKRMPRPGSTDYLLEKTTDWQGLNLEPLWGDGISVLDTLFETGDSLVSH